MRQQASNILLLTALERIRLIETEKTIFQIVKSD